MDDKIFSLTTLCHKSGLLKHLFSNAGLKSLADNIRFTISCVLHSAVIRGKTPSYVHISVWLWHQYDYCNQSVLPLVNSIKDFWFLLNTSMSLLEL